MSAAPKLCLLPHKRCCAQKEELKHRRRSWIDTKHSLRFHKALNCCKTDTRIVVHRTLMRTSHPNYVRIRALCMSKRAFCCIAKTSAVPFARWLLHKRCRALQAMLTHRRHSLTDTKCSLRFHKAFDCCKTDTHADSRRTHCYISHSSCAHTRVSYM